MTNAEVIKIGNVTAKVKSLSIGAEPIWSSNAGRASSGTMIGDIIAWKTTLQVVFAPMSRQTAITISNAIKKRRYEVTFINPETNAAKKITCYGVPFNFGVYNYVAGPTYSDLPVNFVEE